MTPSAVGPGTLADFAAFEPGRTFGPMFPDTPADRMRTRLASAGTSPDPSGTRPR
jgi:hypothetical protein